MKDQPPVDETVDEGLVPPGESPGDRIRVGGDPEIEQESPQEAEEFPITELTAEEREQFRSLLTIGKRTKKFSLFDHTVVIASLNCDDEIRVGSSVKEHRDSQGFARAYQVATVAAAIRSVSGESWGNTLAENPDPDEVFQRKRDKVAGMYPLVVQYIYQEVVKLDTEFAELARKLGKL